MASSRAQQPGDLYGRGEWAGSMCNNKRRLCAQVINRRPGRTSMQQRAGSAKRAEVDAVTVAARGLRGWRKVRGRIGDGGVWRGGRMVS
jgi:hypothetical protein